MNVSTGKKQTGRGTGPDGGSRQLRTRVRTAKKRKISSTRWLERQLNDPYVAEAKKRGYRSRAAFKLLEINQKHKILKPGQVVVDLGCAPGGWCQVAADIVRPQETGGFIVGIDLAAVEPLDGVELVEGDFLEEDTFQQLRDLIGERKVDVVLSDMAAHATGHKRTDHMKIMALCEAAFEFAIDVLKENGSFCAKVLKGGTENEILRSMKRHFSQVRHVKPDASRSDSAESYVLATGFRRTDTPDPEEN